MNKDQIIVRISMENGVPRVRPLTAKEQKQFTKTHPNLELPTYSLSEMTDALEGGLNRITDPKTISVVNGLFAR